MIFVANLRPPTIQAFEKHQIQPSAYLLSTHRATPSMVRHAHAIREAGLPLFADNGTKALIEDVIEKYKQAARPIAVEVRRIRRQIGRTPRGKSVPADLRRQASELAHAVVQECTARSEQIDWKALLDQQIAMNATHIIAQEDFGGGSMMALNLERETTGWPIAALERRNRRSLRLFERVADDPRCRDLNVYAVLSALDYNTARAAGRLAARFGVTHVALGIAGITRDHTAVDFYVLGRSSYKLDCPVPRRYARLAQIARGVADGYREAGARLEAFHALGLGAATMFPILPAAFDAETYLTIDATSPIHDAVRDRVFYDPERNGDRLSQLHIVRQIVRGEDWHFDCPFCQAFRDEHGHDVNGVRAWWEQNGQPKIEWDHLRADGPLVQFIPMFTKLEGTAASEATRARVAHNHWVLDRVTEQVPQGATRRPWAMTKIEELLGYESLVTARGLGAAREILQKNWHRS